jgi:hypothetical protein
LHLSSDIKVIKLRTIRWIKHVTFIRKLKNALNVLVRSHKMRGHTEHLG